MVKRVLVIYASRTGTTAEVAAEIGKAWAARGWAVDVRPAKDDPPLADYQAVVIGSAIRMGRWLTEAVDYVRRHASALGRLPVAVFTVHALNTGDDPPSRAYREAYLDELRPLRQPRVEAFFPGQIAPARLCLFERLTLRVDQSARPKDLRDWGKIQGWAHTSLA